MATALQILTLALRDLGVIGEDQQPNVEMQVVGLEVLTDLLDTLVDGYCPDLYPVTYAASAELGGNVRARATASGITLTAPAAPNDGWRVRILNASAGSITFAHNGHLTGATAAAAAAADETIATAATLDRFFRQDLGAWISPSITALADALPYPTAFDQGLTAMLTIQLAPKYAMTDQLTPMHGAMAQATQDALLKRYGARR